MAKQTVLVTALPNGVAGGTLRLSAFFSPRLEAGQSGRDTLGQWPDWRDWPATGLEFKVLIPGADSQAGVRLGPSPSSPLWGTLFPPETPVRPYAFKAMDGRRVRSYPVRHIMDFVRRQWTDVAVASPDQFPSTTTLLRAEAFGGIDFFSPVGVDRAAALASDLEGLLQAHGAVDPDDSPGAELSFFQAREFHRPVSTRRDPLQVPAIDFHQMLTSLLAYPRLLRELGLVHDLAFDLPAQMPALGTVRVEVTRSPQEPGGGLFESVTVPLRTEFAFSGSEFRARATNGALQDGRLVLRGDPEHGVEFDLVQIDADGAVLSATSLAANLRQRQHRKTADTPQRAPLPALRSAGISLTRHGRAARQALPLFAGQAQQNATVGAGQAPQTPLRAQDLVRGYAVDVWDSVTRTWHPLSARHSRYEIGGGAAPGAGFVIQQPDEAYPYPEEGGVTMAVTESADPPPAGGGHDLYLRESLFRWDGWSLAARRPGSTVGPDGGATGDDLQNPTPFPLRTAFSAPPGSLPALRFGRTYHVRARALDLAGNGPAFDPGGPDPQGEEAPPTVSHPITYARFEPVSPPVLLPRRPVGHGESLERLVIRSNYDAPAGTTQRHVVPPQAAQLLAEQHGVFDGTAGMDGSEAVYRLLVSRDGDLSGGGVVDGQGQPCAFPDPDNHHLPYFDAGTLRFLTPPDSGSPAPPMVLPYLPDPLARGATLRSLPGNPNDTLWQAWQTHKTPFSLEGGRWYDATPFRLELFEQDPPTPPTFAAGVLRVGIPKAEVARVRLSSFLSGADLDVMGIWRWVRDRTGGPANLRAQFESGLHWMVTPFRELTLVHAVQQPLLPLRFNVLTSDRPRGATFAHLLDEHVEVDGKSSAKLNVRARWTEPVDRPELGEAGPRVTEGRAEVLELPLQPTDTHVHYKERHEFGDTKHRLVTYSARTTTRFWDDFPHPPGDAAPFWRDTDDPDGGGPVALHVLSSAPPAAPRVLYVVPTFGWDTSTPAPGKSMTTRRGGGLRVYLDRPWYSSGEGELLGVVHMKPGAFPNPSEVPNELQPYVTQWGMDPLYLDASPFKTLPGNVPTTGVFRHVAGAHPDLPLSERPELRVAVAGYTPEYDPDRRLWYCDIELAAGHTYWPFVRLALARFQPHAVPGAHLSRVVLADFVQLAPNRTATFRQFITGGQPSEREYAVDVAVTGPGYDSSSAGAGSSVMRVTLQQQRPGISGDLSWFDLGESVLVRSTTVSGPDVAWSGTVFLPGPFGSAPYRLVVREYERIRGDADHLSGASGETTQERLVYVSTYVIFAAAGAAVAAP